MARIFSVVVAISVAVLLVSLVTACLWPHAVEPPNEGGNVVDAVAHVCESIPPRQPTLAPPVPAEAEPGGTPERGVAYVTVEVEINGLPAQ